MRNVSLEKFRGKRDPVALDPAAIGFRAKPVKRETCAGCLFARQESGVCKEAARLAVLAGHPDCDSGAVYVPAAGGVRQMELISGTKTDCNQPSPLITKTD